MTIYILLALVLFAFAFSKKKWPLIITFILLIIVAGFRDVSVGTDSKNYSGIFTSYGENISEVYHVREPLYLLLQFFVAVMGWDYNSLMFITSSIVIIGIYSFALIESKRPNMLILCFYLLYYYFYAINTVRQYDAMVFILLAWHFQKIKKYKLYFLFISIAFCFHNTSIIALVSLLFEKVRIRKKMLITLMLLSFVVGLSPIVQYILVIVGKLVNFSYLYYLSNNFFGINFSPTRFLLTIFCCSLVYLLRTRTIYFRLLAVGICMMNIFAFNPEAARIAQYFTILQIAIIPNIPFLTRDKKKAIMLSTISIIYMICVWSFLLFNNIGEVLPYKFGTVRLFGL